MYTTYDISQLKKEYLRTKLMILGYDSQQDIDKELDSSKGYHVLGKIGHDLEHYTNPLRELSGRKDKNDITIEEYEQEVTEGKLFIENQDELLGRIRSIYSDFGLHMEEKVSEEDWGIYSKIVQKTGMLLRDLVLGSKKRNLASSSKLKEEDEISELIDSHEFALACKIEDEFMAQEFQTFKEYAASYEYDDDYVKETTPAVLLAELVRESDQVVNKKGKYLSAYEKYKKFRDSKITQITITSGMERDDDDAK